MEKTQSLRQREGRKEEYKEALKGKNGLPKINVTLGSGYVGVGHMAVPNRVLGSLLEHGLVGRAGLSEGSLGWVAETGLDSNPRSPLTGHISPNLDIPVWIPVLPL